MLLCEADNSHGVTLPAFNFGSGELCMEVCQGANAHEPVVDTSLVVVDFEPLVVPTAVSRRRRAWICCKQLRKTQKILRQRQRWNTCCFKFFFDAVPAASSAAKDAEGAPAPAIKTAPPPTSLRKLAAALPGVLHSTLAPVPRVPNCSATVVGAVDAAARLDSAREAVRKGSRDTLLPGGETTLARDRRTYTVS